MRKRLLPPDRLDDLLRRRARGVSPKALGAAFGLKYGQVRGLLTTHAARLRALCDELGVEAPKAGNRRRKNGAPEALPPGAKSRKCLTCGGGFVPEDRCNWVCPTCKGTAAWKWGGEAYSLHLPGDGP